MASAGGNEAAVVTALCSATAVICDADIFAALAARDLLDVASVAFDDRLRYVPATRSVLWGNTLSHIYDGFIAIDDHATSIEPFADTDSEDERLAAMARLRKVSVGFDATWKPARAEAALLSLAAARVHSLALVAAYPETLRIGKATRASLVANPPELALYFAHRGGLSGATAGELAVDLATQAEPDRAAYWNGQRAWLTKRAQEAADGQLCDDH